MTAHEPAPQSTSLWQLFMPVQSTSQDDASWQLTRCWQALSPHMTWHGMPAGQVISSGQLSWVVQSITQVSPSHVPGQLDSHGFDCAESGDASAWGASVW